MLRPIRFLVPVLALGLIAAMSYVVRADDAAKPDAATGTISGKVVNKDNAAVAGATVRLFPAPERKHKKQAAEPGEKKARPEPVAEAKSDQDGKFTLPNVPVGNYRLMAGLKGAGAGRVEVTVKAGETENVTVTLEMRTRKPK